MISTISNQTTTTRVKSVKRVTREMGPGKVTADQGGIGFPQVGRAEYREVDNGATAPAYDFVPAGEHLPYGNPQVDYRAV